MQRLTNISHALVHPLDYLHLSSLLTSQHKDILNRVEQFCQQHLHTEQFRQCYEKAQFPYYLLPELHQLNVAPYFIPAPWGKEMPLLVQGFIVAAFAAHDLGFSTFLFLQLPLCARTIALLGSENQKQKVLPELMSFKKICGWALTEKEVGSNSTRLGTTFHKNGANQLLLSGDKRWIGNGVHDYLLVYGNMGNERRVVGALIDLKLQGVSAVKMENKYSFRLVQNGIINFDNVKLSSSDLLPGANSYKTGVENVIKHSRLMVIWNTVGACVGIYNVALKEATSRKQFGKIIAGFQLVQEKLVKMMAEVQAMLLVAKRLTELTDRPQGLEIAIVGMFKAWTTSRGRVVAALGREVMGSRGMAGEGLLKRLLDMEALYTYEGSYDINTLLAGSHLTGLKAFT